MKNKNDARVRYTKQAIKTAFLRLLEKKPVNKITVKEVCENAGLNRATFYAHYEDCYELLEQTENELLEDFTESLGCLRSFDVSELMGAIYDMIEKNIELCEVLVFGNTGAAIVGEMIKIAHDRSITYWREQLTKAGEAELELLFTCLSNGLVHVVVDGYGKYSRDVLTTFVSSMVKNSVAAYM